MKHVIQPALILLLAASVSGCAVATAGIKKGDERSFVGSIKDVNAGRVIEARMTRAYDFKLKGVDVEVAEGIVLLSGNVPTQQDKIEAARIAWSARGIEQVGNEILIKGKQSFVRNTKDGILEKTVRTRLTADKLVKARNFNIETHDGIVYVMGVARTSAELKRAAEIAATTRGAKQVISYARVADLPAEKRMELMAQQSGQPAQQRELPSILQSAPTGPIPQAPSYEAQLPAPITNAPMSQPIPFVAPTAPREIDMGERLGKELPTDEELGAFRTGQAGEAVSIIESAPYYVDPDTGKEIPIRFDADGNIVPLIIR
ncbi:MAG: BON domain-containing protein [Litorimonas sp.]